jgi:hypothetical protein
LGRGWIVLKIQYRCAPAKDFGFWFFIPMPSNSFWKWAKTKKPLLDREKRIYYCQSYTYLKDHSASKDQS